MPWRVLKQSKLEKRAKPGTVIYSFFGHYGGGMANSDTRLTGIKHGAFTLKEDGGYPFFTMPMRDVERIKPPHSDQTAQTLPKSD